MDSLPAEIPEHWGFTFIPKLQSDTYPFIDSRKADLSGRSVLITGASKGFGRATALSFAKAGAPQIALLARSDLSEVKNEIIKITFSAGLPQPKVLTLKANISNRSDVEAAAEKVKAEFDGLDILINNAALGYSWVNIADDDPDKWWEQWEVNVKGTYLMCRSFVPLLLKKSSGLKTVVQISSVGALVDWPGTSAYNSSKTVHLRLNDFLMSEYGKDGLLAYAIHPGAALTELAKVTPEFMHHHLTDQPALAADTLVFLTKERRDWLAARYISATWDMEEFLAKRQEIEDKDLLKLRLRV